MKFVCDDCGFEIEYDTIGKKYIECNKCGGFMYADEDE